jgi:uncharacterized protein YbgA (DUF1722 family)/uncharacterized protein YbbK (DUF523 family)
MAAPRSRSEKPDTAKPIRLGISSCLLGENVRYDGGHKKDHFLVNGLGAHVEWVPVCPELEMGMGVPRETIQLQRENGLIQLVAPKSGTDHTAAMARWAAARLNELANDELRGYVLKKDSPSCGMERVRVYAKNGAPSRDGVGLYAAALMNRFGSLPVEEEGRLHDANLRENFIERVFAYHRLRGLFAPRWKYSDVVDFHTRHKLLLMAHSPKSYKTLGRFVAEGRKYPRQEFRACYEAEFMSALKVHATKGRHANVLQHMMGYFSDELDAASRQELVDVIADYRAGLTPLVVPLTLVRHYVRLHKAGYLAEQIYLNPHPKELMLRNHV